MIPLIAKIFFDELVKRQPIDICRQTKCIYDAEKACYILSVWRDEYAVYPYKCKISRLTTKLPYHHDFLYIFIIHYILRFKTDNSLNKWISEKDIQGGSNFFRGPHEIPTKLITQRYGNNTKKFTERCKLLMGTPIEMADAAFSFKITHNIKVAVLYWKGDDMFGPISKLLFNEALGKDIPLDAVFALAIYCCKKISSSV